MTEVILKHDRCNINTHDRCNIKTCDRWTQTRDRYNINTRDRCKHVTDVIQTFMTNVI